MTYLPHFEPERIVAAAVRIDGSTYSFLPPARHGEVLRLVHTIYGDDYMGREEQGFVTSNGRFVNRKEARLIANTRGQTSHRDKRLSDLFSEDIW